MKTKVSNVTRWSYTKYALMNGKKPRLEHTLAQDHTIFSAREPNKGSVITLKWIFFYEEGILEVDGEMYFVKRCITDHITKMYTWTLCTFDTEFEKLLHKQWYTQST